MDYANSKTSINQGQNRETSYFQSLIQDLEVQNEKYAKMVSRLDSVLLKLANDKPEQKEPGISGTQRGPEGYINTLLSNIEKYGYINNKAEEMISKLEKLF